MGKYKGFGGSGMNQNKKVSNVVKQAQLMQESQQQLKCLRTDMIWSFAVKIITAEFLI